ncbi:MAG: hypothetical protein KDC44_21100, partial [Phaeodactylibacter sp.]|nr:hypothetical protein [Phaeodactylibacter sp.]
MKKSKTLLWHALLSFSLLFSTSNTSSQILIEQEAEIDFTYSGPGNASIKPRSMASNQKTVYISAQGAQLSWTIDLPAAGEYFLNFRYSNDNFNGSPLDSISILVDGQFVAGTLCADTGDGGFGWNVFETTATFSLGMLADQPVTISLLLSANYTGVEIDYLELTSDALLPVPPAPQLLTPVDGATDVATNPTLTWAASTGVDSYRVVVATDAGFSNVVVDETTGNTSWMLSGLTQGSGYFWRVRGTNASGNGPWSAVFSFLVSNPGMDVQFFIDDAVGSPGTTIQILIQIDPSSNAICSFGLDLLYDPNVLSFAGFEEGAILPANWFLNANDNNGALNISGFSQDLSSISTAGNLLVLNFTILPGTTASMTTITFSGGDSGNCQGFDLEVNTSDDGTVEIIPFGTISGQILYFDAAGSNPSAGVPDLTVYLVEQGSGTILDSGLTDSQGNYAFANVPLGTDLEIRPKSDATNQLVDEAMTVTDAFLGFSCATGSLPFTSIFQQKIADANNSCTLNSVDAFVLFNLAVGSISDLSLYGLPDWCFVPQDYSLNDDNWCNAPASILLDALSGDATDQDFVAGIYGDVNGSAYPMLWGPPQDRFNENLGEGAGDTVYFIAPELVHENPETVSA